MKNIKAILSAIGIAALSSLPTPHFAQTILPKKSLPIIVAPHVQEISCRERILSYDITANIPFEVTDNATWVEARKGKDGNVYIHVAFNTTEKPRTAQITFANKEMGIHQVLQLTQGADLSIKPEDFLYLIKKIQYSNTENPSSTTIDNWLKLYNSTNGSFNDIDYTRNDQSNWPPITHIYRLEDFAQAYTNPKNSFYGKKQLYDCVVKGLQYWHDVNPNSKNWWYNGISEPQHMGILLIIMRKGNLKVPKELEQKCIDRMRARGSDPANHTGGNCTDAALHWIYRSCLEENSKDLDYALDNVYRPLAYTTDGGIQHDNSFFQHGPQLYIGGYGDAMLSGIIPVATMTANTKFQMKPDKLNVLSKFIRESFYGTIRGQYMLCTVMGRGMSRINNLRKAGSAVYAKRMMDIDPKNIKEYAGIIARLEGREDPSYGVKPSHTHYFRADYTLHRRPGYTFDVRMVSSRTNRCESGNGENLKTYFLSDGCTNIVLKGDEYFNIFPAWNWTQIPGTTAPQVSSIPKSTWEKPGTSKFAGGVSDSIYGASCYSYFDTYSQVNTGANKSWFFFDEEVVCLGNVQSTSSHEVKTTINQCYHKGSPVYMYDGKTLSQVKDGSHENLQLDWILHNNVGYVFPEKGNIWVNCKEQSGNWKSINTTAKDAVVKEKIFSLGFDHGKTPKNVPYAYIVTPNLRTPQEMLKYLGKKNIEIVSNTNKIQSVYHKNLNIWQIIFFKPGTVAYNNMSITTRQPCAVMLKKMADGQYQLHIADPGQKQGNISLTINLPGKEEQKLMTSFAHTGIYAGATKAFMLK